MDRSSPQNDPSESNAVQSQTSVIKETTKESSSIMDIDHSLPPNGQIHDTNGDSVIKSPPKQDVLSKWEGNTHRDDHNGLSGDASAKNDDDKTSDFYGENIDSNIPGTQSFHLDTRNLEKESSGTGECEEIMTENKVNNESISNQEVNSSSKMLKDIFESSSNNYTSDLSSKESSKSSQSEIIESADKEKGSESTLKSFDVTGNAKEITNRAEIADKDVGAAVKTNDYSNVRESVDQRETEVKLKNIDNEENMNISSEQVFDTLSSDRKDGNEKSALSLQSISCALPHEEIQGNTCTIIETQPSTGSNMTVTNSESCELSSGELDRPSEKTVKYKCTKCSCVTKDKRLFDNHSCDREFGPEDERVKITIEINKEKNAFVCNECKFTSTGHGFEEHLMCHLMLRPYQCLYCKECFINRREISRHVIKSHNGAKMSCALRALRRAKGLIKDVTAAGTLSFMARVAGKVPLEKDPEKKRTGTSPPKILETDSMSPIAVPQKDESKELKEKEESFQAQKYEKEELNATSGGSDQQDSASKSSSDEPFSKLREVLTSENPLQLVEDMESEETGTSSSLITKEDGKDQKVNEDQGLKIIASYSLHEETASQEMPTEENKDRYNAKKSPQPNFIMASPSHSPEPEPELVSFLDPEHKQSEAPSPILPPPPLRPAPLHSETPVASVSSDILQRSSMPVKQEKIPNFFICSFNCSFNSLSKFDFLEHLNNFHSTETSFTCYYCGYKSSRNEELVNHVAYHGDSSLDKKTPLFTCSLMDCQFGSNMTSDFINHVKTAHSGGNKPACNACVSVFSEVSLLQTHLEENIINIVNCPHCPSKATERRAILNHISSEHPGKPKMVSVAKQLICRDRKMNGFEHIQQAKEMLPPSLTPAPSLSSNSSQGSSVLDQILRRERNSYSGTVASPFNTDVLTGSSSTSQRNTPSPASCGMSPFSSKNREDSPESGRSPMSETSSLSGMRVKEEIEEMDYENSKETDGAAEGNSSYVIDENGVKRRLYVPMSERHAENFQCQFCTFVARDLKRLNCHERSHGMPPTRKDRFKCMFCPQGFDSEMKFRLHITCHPGLIKFLLYKCKKCEFDSNQKHTIVKHITCNRDRKHRGIGPVEDQYTLISRSLESRVLECEQCDYMTRHKVHMAIHYQREHGILRDKSDFTIEGLTPLDTPVTDPEFSQPYYDMSPQNEGSSQFLINKSLNTSRKRKESASSEGTNLSMGEIYQRNELFTRLVSQQAALQPGHVLENQARKFKCPICKYLLPKAADLKNHVKRHSEIGRITLVMFRCKYCSCMSTARELLYDHLREKHPGKSIALVKKIVAIDTTETDKSFAETSVEESLQQLEESVHNEIMTAINNNNSNVTQIQAQGMLNQSSPSATFEQLFVIPEGGDTFPDALQCPKCSYKSRHRDEIVRHVTGKHAEVKIISSDVDVDNMATSSNEDLYHNKMSNESGSSAFGSQDEVLIVPDEPNFKELALCSRCDFSTMFRKDMVLHLQQNHPEISVMGRNSYPVQVSTMGSKLGENVLEESCVVGSGSLDAKLRCLYENYGTQMRCLICGIERPKKFFIHVHILRHLNVYLWKCTFCSHRGLQKYKMVDHIKKIHPGCPMSVRYLRVNVESRVAQFVAQFKAIQNRSLAIDNESYDDFMGQSSDDDKIISQKFIGGSPHALGSDELDMKISCLYDFSDGLFYKCVACNNQFQRKFAIHRHIIISHLKVALLSCSYCGMQGVEKHQMVDHIIACHQSQPVNFQTNDVDIDKAVAYFISKSSDEPGLDENSPKVDYSKFLKKSSTSNSGEGAAWAEDYYNSGYSLKNSGSFNSGTNFKFPHRAFGSKFSGSESLKKTTGNKNKTIVDPGVIMLGREALDKELNRLYQVRPGGQFRCLICRWEFPRKYPLHRHIMLKHLRMNLVACPYCPFNGVEKYTVSTHIKEAHKDQPISIKYVQPDVQARVHQFLDDMSSGSCTIKKRMSSSSPPSLSTLIKMKREKSSDIEHNRGEEEDAGEDEEKEDQKSSEGTQGLVVAMFGKKSKTATQKDDIVIKREVEDDDYVDDIKPDLPETSQENNEEEDESDHDNSFNYDKEDSKEGYEEEQEYEDTTFRKPNYLKRVYRKPGKMEAYAPGSYRSPTGGKPKALDVITKIKVLKAREGPITKFYCEKCKFTSVHRSNIVRHIYKIHERYQTHTCPVCHYQTLSLMLMKTHINKEHPGVEYSEDSFTLHPPHTKPRSRSLLGLHKFQNRRRKQKPRTPSFNFKVPPPSSNSSNGGHGPKQYACAYCHYETNTQEDILEHTRENHSQSFSSSEALPPENVKVADKSKACWDRSKKAVKRKLSEGSDAPVPRSKRKFVFEKGDELIQCGHCDVRETSMGRIQHHMEWDHAGMPMKFKRIPAWRFVCKTCAVKTMATSKMKYHLNRHCSYRPYTCINCGAFFPSPDQCRRHARSNRHEEQYMYVRNAKKEQRVEEMLQDTRQLALKIQEDAFNDPEFNISKIDDFMARYQDVKNNLKRSGAASGSRVVKKARATARGTSRVKKQVGKSPQTLGIELNVTIKCYNCEYQNNTVHQVLLHHKETHPSEKFLWTELERGFTCDRTGEALPDCDMLPSASGDVGYSTKMTLGIGSNSMRFKCKSCDFSSCVIQAMKSHLKSHQPKGFICPYCSRSFSGKEKLMRHQYCLHKGLSIWVIHLRKPSAQNLSVTTKVRSGSKQALHDSQVIDKGSEGEEQFDVESGSSKKSSSQLRYVCNECSFSSDSLLQYRQHLSKAHVKEASASLGVTEEEQRSQSPVDKDANFFQCGHCKFQGLEIRDIEEHCLEAHSELEVQVLDLRSHEEEEGIGCLNEPLLNLEPRVSVKRIPSSTIAWYDDSSSPGSVIGNEDDDPNMASTMEGLGFEDSQTDAMDMNRFEADSDLLPHGSAGEEEDNLPHLGDGDENDVEEENFDEEMDDSSSLNKDPSHFIDSIEKGRGEDDEDSEGREEVEEKVNESDAEYEENVDTEMSNASADNTDDLARQLGLVDDHSSSLMETDSEMMIMEFDGIQRNCVLADTLQNDYAANDDLTTGIEGTDVEEEEEDGEDGDEFDENSVTLASPLPMISLGDGVTMSPDDMFKSEGNQD